MHGSGPSALAIRERALKTLLLKNNLRCRETYFYISVYNVALIIIVNTWKQPR